MSSGVNKITRNFRAFKRRLLRLERCRTWRSNRCIAGAARSGRRTPPPMRPPPIRHQPETIEEPGFRPGSSTATRTRSDRPALLSSSVNSMTSTKNSCARDRHEAPTADRLVPGQLPAVGWSRSADRRPAVACHQAVRCVEWRTSACRRTTGQGSPRHRRQLEPPAEQPWKHDVAGPHEGEAEALPRWCELSGTHDVL